MDIIMYVGGVLFFILLPHLILKIQLLKAQLKLVKLKGITHGMYQLEMIHWLEDVAKDVRSKRLNGTLGSGICVEDVLQEHITSLRSKHISGEDNKMKLEKPKRPPCRLIKEGQFQKTKKDKNGYLKLVD